MIHEHWRTNIKHTQNIIIRLEPGGYISGDLYHSQSIEGALSTFPGIRVVYPSFADDTRLDYSEQVFAQKAPHYF